MITPLYQLAKTVELQPCPCDLGALSLLEAIKQGGVMTREEGHRYRLAVHVTAVQYAQHTCALIAGQEWNRAFEICVMPEYGPDEWAVDCASQRVHSAA